MVINLQDQNIQMGDLKKINSSVTHEVYYKFTLLDKYKVSKRISNFVSSTRIQKPFVDCCFLHRWYPAGIFTDSSKQKHVKFTFSHNKNLIFSSFGKKINAQIRQGSTIFSKQTIHIYTMSQNNCALDKAGNLKQFKHFL